MTYELFIGDQTFSSWSLRGWLMLDAFEIPYETRMVGLYSGSLREDLAHVFPARFVPAMRDADGIVVFDTLAMAETLAERYPEKKLWPKAPVARGLARSISAEMHVGFGALRAECPMQLHCQWKGFEPSKDVLADLDRIQTLWTLARKNHGETGPWLFGDYSLADVFYAPVAARIAGYGLPVGDVAQDYVGTVLSDMRFRQWRAMGLTKSYAELPYALDLPRAPWPGPGPCVAEACEDHHAENTACPYTAKPVAYYLKAEGRIFGFGTAFDRDKTVIDPDAWPSFRRLKDGA